MTDLTKDVNRLKLVFVPKGATRDKDLLKEESYNQYCGKVCAFFGPALGLQIYQMSLINKPDMITRYTRVAQFKLNRFYPEPTEFQKNLSREADLFLYRKENEKEFENKTDLGIRERMIYKQMYKLNPNLSMIPQGDIKPVDFKNQ